MRDPTDPADLPLVRPATAADTPQIVALLLQQMRDHRIPIPAAHLTEGIEARLRDGEARLLVAAPAGGAELVGVAYVSFARPLEHRGEVAWLEELFVLPAWRARGVGGRLIEEVQQLATARGCVSVDLEVDEEHLRAANLYQRMGFRSMRRTHYTCPLKDWDWDPL